MKNERKKWTVTERTMLTATLILCAVLAIKSLYFDTVKTNIPEEQTFLNTIQTEMNTEEKDFWHKTSLVMDRIVAIKKLPESEIKALKDQGVTTQTVYKAKTRSYFLFIIPFNEQYRILNDQERKSP